MRFIKSFCTNTRLMGTMMMMIEWINHDHEIVSHVFMLDAEGLGISDFYELKYLTYEQRNLFYKKKYGGLGGININLALNESLYLVKQYLNKNISYNKILPEKMNHDIISFYSSFNFVEKFNKVNVYYERMLNYENDEKNKHNKESNKDNKICSICDYNRKKLFASIFRQEGYCERFESSERPEEFKSNFRDEKFKRIQRFEEGISIESKILEINPRSIFDKISKKFESPVEFVQYMIMRFVARDREALYHYSNREELSKSHISEINGTLLYSQVSKMMEYVYKSEFVFEDEDGYYEASAIVKFSNIDDLDIEKNTINKDFEFLNEDIYQNYKLTSIIVIDKHRISEWDVQEIMEKEEFVDIYKFEENITEEQIKEEIYQKFLTIQEIEFNSCNLYTQYFSDNTHVEEFIYSINSDIMFNIFIRNNTLYLFTYDENYRSFTHDFLQSVLSRKIQYDKYVKFDTSILLDFIDSDSIDLDEYIDDYYNL